MAIAEERPVIKDFARINQSRATKLLGISKGTFRKYELQGLIISCGSSGKSKYYLGRDVRKFYDNLFKVAVKWG